MGSTVVGGNDGGNKSVGGIGSVPGINKEFTSYVISYLISPFAR